MICGSKFHFYMVLQAGMFAIRARRKVATERDFLDAVEKVVRQGTKFSSTWVLVFDGPGLCLTLGIGHCIKCITEVEYIVITVDCRISYLAHNHATSHSDHVSRLFQRFIRCHADPLPHPAVLSFFRRSPNPLECRAPRRRLSGSPFTTIAIVNLGVLGSASDRTVRPRFG